MVLFVLWGCVGPELVVEREIAPGAGCAGGGVETSIGHDADGDGVLDADEVESHARACAPPLLTVTEAAEVCLGEGRTVRTGHDDDQDHALDPEEIEAEVTACPGAVVIQTREDGGCTIVEVGFDTNGDGALAADEVTDGTEVCDAVLVTSDPATDCPHGGQVVNVGADADADGALDPEEVTSATTLCWNSAVGSVFEGSLTLDGTLSLRMLDGVQVITGTLRVEDPSLTTLALPALQRVGGLHIVGAPALSTVALPALTIIDGPLFVTGAPALTTLSLPALTRVRGLTLDTVALVDLTALGALQTVDGDLQLLRAADLTSLAGLDALTTVSGTFALRALPALHHVDHLDALSTVGGLNLDGDAITTVAAFPALTTVDGDLTIGDPAAFGGFPVLTTLSGSYAVRSGRLDALPEMPALTDLGGKLAIESARGLTSLAGLEALRRVDGKVRVRFNPQLVDISALYGLEDAGGLEISVNPRLCTSLLDPLVTTFGGAVGSVNREGC